VKRWNGFEQEDKEGEVGRLEDEVSELEAEVSDLQDKVNGLIKEVGVKEKGASKVLVLLLEHRERLMTGEDDDSRLDDAIRILGGLV
jgi:hypothetical protein